MLARFTCRHLAKNLNRLNTRVRIGIMSSQTLQDFQARTIKAESMVKSLQQQLQTLQQQIHSNNTSKRPLTSSSNNQSDESKEAFSGTFQPNKTYPVWYTPYNEIQSKMPDQIMVINSLCPTAKVPFVPKNGRLVKWYTCGPTVYAPSHMGHARTYITFDIIRNILEYYFHFRVNLVMNITDVDDKIILRARQNYLYDQYRTLHGANTDKIIADTESAFNECLTKREKKVAAARQSIESALQKHKKDMEEMMEGEKVKLSNVRKDHEKYKGIVAKLQNGVKEEERAQIVEEMLNASKSVLSEWLDAKQGSTVKDQKIFRAHAERFETEFFEDMRALNIRDPDVLTRVTEYVPEIVQFVEKLIENGYGYESNGSVYFDSGRYIEKHDYPKLDPKKLDNKALMDEGEGSLASNTIDSERKSPRDFALWKKSKSGEPQWKSPWGMGRPGCAMASQIHGDNMDIHTGGEDLKFPHHDNEMAQSCAFFSEPKKDYYHKQWVNYWFHAGHLHIGGLKMSKSLKNFITIRQALELTSTRQIRLLFLLQSWFGKMNYSDDSIQETRVKEHQLEEFFLLINALNRKYNKSSQIASTPYLPSNQKDADLNQKVMALQIEVDEALRDNFDYVTATTKLFDLMNEINSYIKSLDEVAVPNMLLLNKSASFINDMLKIFGVVPQSETFFLGSKQIEAEQYLAPLLDVVTWYRSELTLLFRKKAVWTEYRKVVEQYHPVIEGLKSELKEEEEKQIHSNNTSNKPQILKESGNPKSDEIVVRREKIYNAILEFDGNMRHLTDDATNDSSKELIKITDKMRDAILPQFGVKIEDLEGAKGSIWKLYEPQALLKMLSSGDMEKVRKRIEHLTRELEQWRKKAVKPEDLFRQTVDDNGVAMYSQFDAQGIPTHDAAGQPVSKGKKKKMPKLKKKQEAAYKKYQEKLKANPNFVSEMEEELKQLEELGQ